MIMNSAPRKSSGGGYNLTELTIRNNSALTLFVYYVTVANNVIEDANASIASNTTETITILNDFNIMYIMRGVIDLSSTSMVSQNGFTSNDKSLNAVKIQFVDNPSKVTMSIKNV